MIIVLDTFPTTSVAKRPGRTPSRSDQCHEWIEKCEDAGHTILVPAISYYEALREFERRQATSQIGRLRAFCLLPTCFIPLTTAHLETAAQLWRHARRGGRPTAANAELDGDVILAAQALSLGVAAPDLTIATTNVSHLAHFVPCDDWANIAP